MASSASLTTTHLPHLRQELEVWRQKQTAAKPFTSPLQDIVTRLDARDTKDASGKDVIVAFRTRPPLEHEAEDKFKAYATDKFSQSAEQPPATSAESESTEVEAAKIEFCTGITVASAEPGVFVAHVPGYKWSGPTLTHKKFDSDIAFGPDVDNEEVYQRTIVANDMLPLALASGTACILAYGQTGSGKTYTMEALEYRVARDLFIAAERIGTQLVESERQGAKTAEESSGQASGITGADVFEFSVTFLELLGKRAVDLLEPVDGLPVDDHGNPIRKEIPVQENKNGDVRPRLIAKDVTSAEQLQELITSALAHRRVSATARNATSSRSHAILTIRVKNKLLPFAEDGQLILVDLAGSERYEDSKAHDKQRMAESRDNNNSLMNLKECVRSRAKMAQEDGFVHIPWRSNKLTMVLKPLFDIETRQPSKAIVIAHVSPHIQDSTHSVNTLSYAAPFKTTPPKPRGPAPYNPADPRTWNHEKTVEWFEKAFTDRARARQVNAHKIRADKAAREGKKIKPLDPETPLHSAVDVAKLCPAGMTAKNFGAMNTVDFVQRCLEAGNIGGDVTASVLRNTAVEVIGSLFYLILTAKTKLRRDIMKSRRSLSLAATYGETPHATIPGTDIRMPTPDCAEYEAFSRYTPEQYRAAAESNKTEWYHRINLATSEAFKNQRDMHEALWEETIRLMEEFTLQGSQGTTAAAV